MFHNFHSIPSQSNVKPRDYTPNPGTLFQTIRIYSKPREYAPNPGTYSKIRKFTPNQENYSKPRDFTPNPRTLFQTQRICSKPRDLLKTQGLYSEPREFTEYIFTSDSLYKIV